MTRKALAHAPRNATPNVAALQHDLERYLSRMGWGDFKTRNVEARRDQVPRQSLRVRRLAEGEVGLLRGGPRGPMGIGTGPHLATDDVHERPRASATPRSERARRIPVRQWQQSGANLGVIALTMTTIMGTFAWTASQWTARGAPAGREVFDELAAMHASAIRLASLSGGDNPNASAAGVLVDSTACKASPLAPPEPGQIPVPGSHARTKVAPSLGGRAPPNRAPSKPGDDLPSSARGSLARGLDEGYPYLR